MRVETDEIRGVILKTLRGKRKRTWKGYQDKVILERNSDFPIKIFETDNEAIEEISLGFAGDIHIYTKNGKRINVFIKHGKLEINLCSIDEVNRPFAGTECRLEGKWVEKEKPCPHCGQLVKRREDFLIDLNV